MNKEKKALEWVNNEELGYTIWNKKYRYGKESFDEWIDRVGMHNESYKEAILEKLFIPGGRILSNIGTPNEKAGLSNCFSRGFIEDEYNDIMQAAMDIGKTFKAQGGQGLSLSKLRPKGTPIGTTNEYASDGIIPFMKIYNEVTEGTSNGGSRKGALLISLDAWHKEIMGFITIKSDLNLIQKANLSVELDDDFMEIVEKDLKYNEETTITRRVHYGENKEHEVEYEVIPVKIFKKIAELAWDYGEPGCIFVNQFRNYNLMECVNDYQIETCNPCKIVLCMA